MPLFSWFQDSPDHSSHSREVNIKEQLNQSMWPIASVRKSLLDNDLQPRLNDLKKASGTNKKQIRPLKEQLVK